MHHAMGALFYRGASPTEIESMSWERIRYWYRWHLVLAKTERGGK
jgi:hypothetical protein